MTVDLSLDTKLLSTWQSSAERGRPGTAVPRRGLFLGEGEYNTSSYLDFVSAAVESTLLQPVQLPSCNSARWTDSRGNRTHMRPRRL